jgi:hypothetical protein
MIENVGGMQARNTAIVRQLRAKWLPEVTAGTHYDSGTTYTAFGELQAETV